jgi:hypothetical protein
MRGCHTPQKFKPFRAVKLTSNKIRKIVMNHHSEFHPARSFYTSKGWVKVLRTPFG